MSFSMKQGTPQAYAVLKWLRANNMISAMRMVEKGMGCYDSSHVLMQKVLQEAELVAKNSSASNSASLNADGRYSDPKSALLLLRNLIIDGRWQEAEKILHYCVITCAGYTRGTNETILSIKPRIPGCEGIWEVMMYILRRQQVIEMLWHGSIEYAREKTRLLLSQDYCRHILLRNHEGILPSSLFVDYEIPEKDKGESPYHVCNSAFAWRYGYGLGSYWKKMDRNDPNIVSDISRDIGKTSEDGAQHGFSHMNEEKEENEERERLVEEKMQAFIADYVSCVVQALRELKTFVRPDTIDENSSDFLKKLSFPIPNSHSDFELVCASVVENLPDSGTDASEKSTLESYWDSFPEEFSRRRMHLLDMLFECILCILQCRGKNEVQERILGNSMAFSGTSHSFPRHSGVPQHSIQDCGMSARACEEEKDEHDAGGIEENVEEEEEEDEDGEKSEGQEEEGNAFTGTMSLAAARALRQTEEEAGERDKQGELGDLGEEQSGEREGFGPEEEAEVEEGGDGGGDGEEEDEVEVEGYGGITANINTTNTRSSTVPVPAEEDEDEDEEEQVDAPLGASLASVYEGKELMSTIDAFEVRLKQQRATKVTKTSTMSSSEQQPTHSSSSIPRTPPRTPSRTRATRPPVSPPSGTNTPYLPTHTPLHMQTHAEHKQPQIPSVPEPELEPVPITEFVPIPVTVATPLPVPTQPLPPTPMQSKTRTPHSTDTPASLPVLPALPALPTPPPPATAPPALPMPALHARGPSPHAQRTQAHARAPAPTLALAHTTAPTRTPSSRMHTASRPASPAVQHTSSMQSLSPRTRPAQPLSPVQPASPQLVANSPLVVGTESAAVALSAAAASAPREAKALPTPSVATPATTPTTPAPAAVAAMALNTSTSAATSTSASTSASDMNTSEPSVHVSTTTSPSPAPASSYTSPEVPLQPHPPPTTLWSAPTPIRALAILPLRQNCRRDGKQSQNDKNHTEKSGDMYVFAGSNARTLMSTSITKKNIAHHDFPSNDNTDNSKNNPNYDIFPTNIQEFPKYHLGSIYCLASCALLSTSSTNSVINSGNSSKRDTNECNDGYIRVLACASNHPMVKLTQLHINSTSTLSSSSPSASSVSSSSSQLSTGLTTMLCGHTGTVRHITPLLHPKYCTNNSDNNPSITKKDLSIDLLSMSDDNGSLVDNNVYKYTHLLTSGAGDNMVRQWDVQACVWGKEGASGKGGNLTSEMDACECYYKGHTGAVYSVVTDGRYIVSGGADKTLCIFPRYEDPEKGNYLGNSEKTTASENAIGKKSGKNGKKIIPVIYPLFRIHVSSPISSLCYLSTQLCIGLSTGEIITLNMSYILRQLSGNTTSLETTSLTSPDNNTKMGKNGKDIGKVSPPPLIPMEIDPSGTLYRIVNGERVSLTLLPLEPTSVAADRGNESEQLPSPPSSSLPLLSTHQSSGGGVSWILSLQDDVRCITPVDTVHVLVGGFSGNICLINVFSGVIRAFILTSTNHSHVCLENMDDATSICDDKHCVETYSAISAHNRAYTTRTHARRTSDTHAEMPSLPLHPLPVCGGEKITCIRWLYGDPSLLSHARAAIAVASVNKHVLGYYW